MMLKPAALIGLLFFAILIGGFFVVFGNIAGTAKNMGVEVKE